MEYIDMHSHILPGLDDGSKNMEMTLAMLRVAVEEGIGTIYTTPIVCRGRDIRRLQRWRNGSAWYRRRPRQKEFRSP